MLGNTSVLSRASSTAGRRGAGFWIQTFALIIDFLIPTVVPSVIVFIQPAWGGIWVPFTLALTFVYLTVFTASSSHPAFGLWLFGLRARQTDGGDLGPILAAYRSLLVMCSVALCGLGVIAIAFDAHKQGWHDRLTSTVVVRVGGWLQ
jgi:uncharacterized RDD family membrane protein YckC